jgi:hypothetical protein
MAHVRFFVTIVQKGWVFFRNRCYSMSLEKRFSNASTIVLALYITVVWWLKNGLAN